MAFGQSGWGTDTLEDAEIILRSDPTGAYVSFDPIGLLIRPGQRVRWVNDGNNVHTTTAYHPDNANHPLRIPASAMPWDSGYLVRPGDHFETVLNVEGIYDYYCAPHEAAGMVGRIIVAEANKPRSEPLIPYPDDSGNSAWTEVPAMALKNFPSVESILNQGAIHLAPGRSGHST